MVVMGYYGWLIMCFKCFHINWQYNADRIYLDGKVKLKWSFIDRMKKMNQIYPKLNQDFDAEFIFFMVDAVFSKTDLRPILAKPSLRLLDREKLAFVKGMLCSTNNICDRMYW